MEKQEKCVPGALANIFSFVNFFFVGVSSSPFTKITIFLNTLSDNKQTTTTAKSIAKV